MIESVIITFLAISLFILGIATHKYLLSSQIDNNLPKSFIKSNNENTKLVSDIVLNEKKVVLKIDTSNLEKKTDLITNTVIGANDTINAIDKLKNMKGK
jgi:hypothetical protein